MIDEDIIKENVLKEKGEKILSLINSELYIPMKMKEMISFMEVPINEADIFLATIKKLEQDGKIYISERNKILSPTMLKLYYGTYIKSNVRFGFISLEDKEITNGQDMFIKDENSIGARHKDKVLCKIKAKYDGKKPEGEIVKIVQKTDSKTIGTFEASKNFGFVVPTGKHMYKDIYIGKNNTLGAITGHRVVIEITKEGTKDKKPEGKIVEIIGHINDPNIEILSIIAEYNLNTDFDEKIYNEIENIPDVVLENEIKGRKDLRNIRTITIDGEDAKDLDDAITIEKLDDGAYRLGVHIADVTHYVKKGSYLDKEAINRGTSIYLVDRVIPMLPHKLSNGICSLNECTDRLTLSCIMDIDSAGDICSYEIVNTVINVDKRMSYTIVNDILTNEESEYIEENEKFLQMFSDMKILRDRLFNRRIKRGAIELDFPEAKIILDEKGTPVDIKIYERNIATSIIEEFMLIANETVAEHHFWLDIPFVYRSHKEPEIEKVEELSDFVGKLGYTLKSNKIHPKAFQNLIKSVKGQKEDKLINKMVLMSFNRAKYTHRNYGHFGLSAKYYCHFTSPIRRYPDLQIHRIIKARIDNGISINEIKKLNITLPTICEKCSVKERTAEEAERKTVKYKKTQYMQDKIGQIFTGTISGANSKGLYVELENTVEGLISIEKIEDDHYFYDEKNMSYFGEKSGKVYSIGDKVSVRLMSVSLEDMYIDFKLLQ